MNVAAVSVTHNVVTLKPFYSRRISDATVALVKSASHLEEIVSDVVSLRPSGRHLIGACPFHESKSRRSFSVDPKKQVWYCHGCTEGGDVIGFYERLHHTGFRGAVELLAIRAGVELEEVTVSPVLIERIRNEKLLREVEQRITDSIQLHYLYVLRQYDHARRHFRRVSARLDALNDGAAERFPNELETAWHALADVLHDLRNIDVVYCLIAFGNEEERNRFLCAERDKRVAIVAEIAERGYVGSGGRMEVPIQ